MITSIAHVAYRVQDLEKSLDFFCRILGLEEAFRLLHDDGEPWLVYLRVGDSGFIELFPEGKKRFPTSPEAIGFAHLCLYVDDIFAAVDQLRERGLECPGAPTLGKDGNWQYWIKDPDGNDIELMQLMPDSLQMKNR